MKLKTVFIIVALVEITYALLAMTPPGSVNALTGWVLTTDGHWLLKLFGMALGAQAYLAWSSRNEPTLSVARSLAFYQLASATVDWVMWIVLDGQGTFSTSFGQALIVSAIVSHYGIGILLVVSMRQLQHK